jgi:hypothetical protein
VTILLKDIWALPDPCSYKIHFAREEPNSQPLEVWLRSKEAWQGWQEYRPKVNAFNRPLIFSLIQFYHETDIWLFGGVYRVLTVHNDRYEVELTETLRAFEVIG